MAASGVTRHGNASTGSAHGFEGKAVFEFVGGMEERSQTRDLEATAAELLTALCG